ncbi:hypothetical protein [Novosphingobium mathurense]|uniref:Uncharacterized protein n=1 Tax=Novosphingobium mathurense TaxID=428990 RepID=A0A1U6GSW6_9SPHN|nr:hypothetical protein [Novosphingobium mathurense]SLJ86633.1 hypothetical protein SAMN06295987_101317 [Novosphingobium mathurense]
MSERDPAAARFAVIQIVRLLGVAFVVTGILVANGNHALPAWLGHILIAVGLADTFIVPKVLARKWRTPK